MKLPRGVSADRVILALERPGYSVIRQKGSHVRLRHEGPPVHMITVPLHNPLKIGTLHDILSETAQEEVDYDRINRRFIREPTTTKLAAASSSIRCIAGDRRGGEQLAEKGWNTGGSKEPARCTFRRLL